jgi:hypothetical protein
MGPGSWPIDTSLTSRTMPTICRETPGLGGKLKTSRYLPGSAYAIPTRHQSRPQFRELRRLERSREITEGSLAHGRNDVARSKFVGEDNQADMRASTPDFAKKFNILRDASFPPGDDQIVA